MPDIQIKSPKLMALSRALTTLTYALSLVLGILLIPTANIASAVIIPFAALCLYASMFKRWRVEMVSVWPLSFGFFIYGAYVVSSLPGLATVGILVVGGIAQGVRLIKFSYALEVTRKQLIK